MKTSPCFVQLVGAVRAVPTEENWPNRVMLLVLVVAPNTVAGAVPPATLSTFAACKIAPPAPAPARDIPDASPPVITTAVDASAEQSNVTVIADGEAPVSWFAMKKYSVSRLDDFSAFVETRVNVIPFAEAVRVGAAAVDAAAAT